MEKQVPGAEPDKTISKFFKEYLAELELSPPDKSDFFTEAG